MPVQPSVAPKPTSRQFPPAPCPISKMSRNQAANYAKLLVDFLCEPKQKRGVGVCVEWEEKVSARLLSEKSRLLLKLKSKDEISLEEIRSWSPGMKLPASFKQGPPKNDSLWRKDISWSSFLRVIVEIVSALFGQNGESSKSSSPAPSTRPSTSCPPSSAAAAASPLGGLPVSKAPAMLSPTPPPGLILTGDGPLSDCLTDWVVKFQHLTLSSLPLDVQHPPRLQVYCPSFDVWCLLW